jgi:hypothetical protein
MLYLLTVVICSSDGNYFGASAYILKDVLFEIFATELVIIALNKLIALIALFSSR